jgi:hypothetical protein
MDKHFSHPQPFAGTASPSLIVEGAAASSNGSFVMGDTTYSYEVSPGISDAEREAAILCAGKAIERHMASCQRALLDYDISNNLLDKADADRYRLMAEEAQRHMTALIKGRSAEVIARLEQERGLA